MAEIQKAPVSPAPFIIDKNTITRIAEIFKPQKGKRLIWDSKKPFLPDGKKNQYWENKDIDWEKHLSGELKQGGNLACDGEAKAFVIDIDREKGEPCIEAKDICESAWKVDTQLICFQSPSKNWHIYKFFHKPQPLNHVAAEAINLERIFKKLGFKVDPGHTLPKANGSQLGINFPLHTHQMPYAPTGEPLTVKQFIHRYRFQKYPLIAAATGMKEPGRHTALIKIAALLEQHKGIHHLDEVINNFGTKFDDEKYIKRIKQNGIHKKYFMGSDGIATAITEIVGFDYKVEEAELKNWEGYDEYEDVTFDPKPPKEKELEPLELFEYTGGEELEARPWVIPGWVMLKTMTLIVGQPGVGKTILLHMIAYCLAYAVKLLGKDILIPGNVALFCAEETKNEMRLRLKGIEETLGINFKSDKKILIRGLEDELKLVKFGIVDASATIGYKRLKKALVKHNIKYIILDPLISFQTGNYDENSNQKMEQYIKTYLLPLAVEINGAIITGHHTNKLSMVQIIDKELVVDQQNAMASARGASSLVAAARFIVGMQPMTRKLWEHQFKEHVTDGSKFVHYTGLIEAKSNYNVVDEDIAWLKKSEVRLNVSDPRTKSSKVEKIGVFTMTDLNKITKSKNKLKAAKNEEYARAQIPLIKELMKKAGSDIITLNSLISEIIPTVDVDETVPEATVRTGIRRKLENGMSGKVKTKNGMEIQGIEFDDGYNYWIQRKSRESGAARVFIQRGKDFKK